MITSVQNDNTLVCEVTIDASPEKIFAALTDPNQLPQWWGQDGLYHVDEMQADLRVGGYWRSAGTDADGTSFSVEGEYLIVERPHLLELTWRHDWGDAGPTATLVRYELMEQDRSTLLRVTHSGFATLESRDDHSRGWQTVLEWLTAYVSHA